MRLAGQALTWGITILVMRRLQPGDYGLMAMATVLLEYLGTVAELGLGAAIIQAPDISVRRLRAALGLIVIVSCSAALLFFLTAPLVASFYRETRLIPMIRMLSLQFLLSGTMVVPQALAYRKLDLKHVSLVQAGGAVVGGVVTVGLAYAGIGVWALLTGSLVTLSVQAVWINLVSPFPHLPLFSREESRGLLFFGGNVTGVRLLWGLWSEADLLVAGRMLGANALGGYTVAKQFATLPLSKTASLVTQVAFPAFARLQADPESMRTHLLKSLGILALIAFPVTWGISCVAPELVEVVLGRKWILAVVPLQILGIVMSVRLLSQFTSAVVVAAGRPDVDLSNALVFTLLLPAGFIVGSHWGLLGLSLTWVFVFPIAFLWTMRASLKALGTTLGALAGSVAMPAVAGVLMCLATASARWSMDATVGAAARMAVLVAVGAAVYCGFLLAFDRDNVGAAIRTLRAVVRGGRADAA